MSGCAHVYFAACYDVTLCVFALCTKKDLIRDRY